MRILGHLHTFNDEDVIDRSLEALRNQTYPVDEILVIDNGSTDGTLEKLKSKPVTLIRHPDNRGTSGAVVTGIQYALDNRYDWIWLFDGDSAPRKDALEKLIELYESFAPDIREEIWAVASVTVDFASQTINHVVQFTPKGIITIQPDPGTAYLPCDVTIWSGTLYKLSLVERVGLPRADYALDWGEFEYGYRGKRSGYRMYAHPGSIVDHNIGGYPSLRSRMVRFGPIEFALIEMLPFRCYYFTRNLVYFWIHEYQGRNVYTLAFCCLPIGRLMVNFLIRPISHWPQILACLRGLRDGLCKKMERRY